MHKISFRILTFFLTFISAALFAQTPEELVKKDWPRSYSAYGKELKSKPLNFIFVLDISEKSFGSQIKEVVTNFLKPVKDGDYFNVILLGKTDKTVNLTKCAIASNAKKEDISSEINNTDFGLTGSNSIKAISLVLDALTCSGANNATPIIFMFSDFVHYDNGWFVPSSKYWEPLVSKYEIIKKDIENPIIYCIELPNKENKAQYLNKLKQIFKDLNTVTCSKPSLLDDQFNDVRAKITKKLLRDFVIKKAESQNANLTLISTSEGIQLKDSEDLVYNEIVLDEDSKIKVSNVIENKSIINIFPPSEISVEVSGTLVAGNYKSEISDLKDLPITNQKVAIMPADAIIPWYIGLTLAALLIFWILSILYMLFVKKVTRTWRVSGTIKEKDGMTTPVRSATPINPTSFCIGRSDVKGNFDVHIDGVGFCFKVESRKNISCLPLPGLKSGYYIANVGTGNAELIDAYKKKYALGNNTFKFLSKPGAFTPVTLKIKEGYKEFEIKIQ
jgi:hypothetical protein